MPTGVNIATAYPLARIPAFGSIGGLISFFVPTVLLIGGILCFVIIVVAGFGVIGNAGGDPHAAEGRKMIITYAMIGLVIMFASYWILQILNGITGKPFGGIFG
jgi:hypothetical protein